MEVNRLSSKYNVRELDEKELSNLLALCQSNPMYYHHCPPDVSLESLCSDMSVLPPGRSMADKHYVGFFKETELIGVMDLIEGYPNEQTAFIGFFMLSSNVQGHGVGTDIITEAFAYLKECGFDKVKLGYAKGNPQSEHFWIKNGFDRTGVEVQNEGYVVVVMEKML